MTARRGVASSSSSITGLASGLVLTAPPPAAAAQALPKVRLVATGGTIANRGGARLSPAELVAPGAGDRSPRADRRRGVRQRLERPAHARAVAAAGEARLDDPRRRRRAAPASSSRRAPTRSRSSPTSCTSPCAATSRWWSSARCGRPTRWSSTAPRTCSAAVRVAAAAESRGRGTLVVMNDEIHGARDVTKTDAQRLDAFQSRGGRLGVVDADRVVYCRRSREARRPADGVRRVRRCPRCRASTCC